jgi:hypothetical protein
VGDLIWEGKEWGKSNKESNPGKKENENFFRGFTN